MRRRISAGSELASLQRRFDELFELVAAPARPHPGGWMPCLDIVELDEEFVIRVDVPGVAAGELDLHLRGGVLHLAGNKRACSASPEERRYHRMERGFGPFALEVVLPAPVRPEGCRATLAGGVLEIILPRLDDRRQLVFTIPIEPEEP